MTMRMLGALTPTQSMHERIVMLYLMLLDEKNALMASQFEAETCWGFAQLYDKENIRKRLVMALCAYEELTGESHPVDAELDSLPV